MEFSLYFLLFPPPPPLLLLRRCELFSRLLLQLFLGEEGGGLSSIVSLPVVVYSYGREEGEEVPLYCIEKIMICKSFLFQKLGK